MGKINIVSKELIDKGWSDDKKYCATDSDGKKYFMRIASEDKSGDCFQVFRLQQEAAALGVPMCIPVEIGRCQEGVYTLHTWVDGKVATDIVPYLADSKQYALGLEAGNILKKIHAIPAPKNQQDWETRFNAKIDRNIKMYKDCPIQFDGADKIIEYINTNRYLLSDRPEVFQHGDYHIGNMMIENDKICIIDFDRYDFGDPWEEFNRIIWCAQAAPIFASGMVNGYFENQVPTEFWKLLALYISSNMLSSVPWAVPFGDGEIQTVLNQARDVLEWYDNMKNVVPSWYFKGYYLQYIDGQPYKMKEPFSFDFVSQYGKVFKVFDDQDSGNICFGTTKGEMQYFIKFAGAPTEAYNGTPEAAIWRLKSTLPIYKALKHKNLIEFVRAEEIGGGFAMIYKWAEGDCMGRMYPAEHHRFMNLPILERCRVFCDLLDFMEYVVSNGYVAIDFYDGSIMYDDKEHKTTICDIDLFRKQPCVNDMGRMYGSALFQSPEEYQLGAHIDEITNVYTVGAMAFALFGNYQRTGEQWQLSHMSFEVAKKAVSDNRKDRFGSIHEFTQAWNNAMSHVGKY